MMRLITNWYNKGIFVPGFSLIFVRCHSDLELPDDPLKLENNIGSFEVTLRWLMKISELQTLNTPTVVSSALSRSAYYRSRGFFRYDRCAQHAFHWFIAICIIVIFTNSASAQNDGFAVNRFDVAEVGSDWFSGDSLDMRGPFRPGFGFTVDWAYKPLVRYDENGDELAVLIENQLHGHIGASVILFERLRIGGNMPVLFYQSGEDLLVDNQQYTAQQGVAAGDLRLALDIRIVGEYGDPASLALGAQVHVPTGNQDAFVSDGQIRVVPRLMLAGDIGIFAYSARASFLYRPADDGFGEVPTGNEVSFVATAGLRVADKKLLIGPELWGSTVISNDDAFKKDTTPFEIIFGASYLAGPWRIGLGVGPGLTQGLGSPTLRALGSLALVMEPDLDRDNDGIDDSEDACPDTPGVPNKDPKKHGCPSDRDNDGIYDVDDACPDVAGLPNNDPKKHGCPPDRDGDGIYDSDDACPDEPGVPHEDPKKHGCPPDRDGDGIYDSDDACPDEPGVASEDPSKNGCPPDIDGDGILDRDDACPHDPGPPNADPNKNGCPVAIVQEDQIKIFERVEFAFNSAKLLPSSDVVLNAVLDILNEHDEITLVRVEGHTDNVGRAKYNLKLSRKRADSVLKWLVEHGIDSNRLQAEGYGFERPLVDNDTPENRQTNRRVEFHIVEIDNKPADETNRPKRTSDTPTSPQESPTETSDKPAEFDDSSLDF
jgi:OOP family OmpA-OmpF porin